MSVKFTDQEIADLLRERKVLPVDPKNLIVINKRGHKEKDQEVRGDQGNDFCLILRQSLLNSFDFSVILSVRLKGTNQLFRLRRYNGKHKHSNAIEGNTLFGFHVHTATQRYQELGSKEDHFAEVTNCYHDFNGALACMIKECGFEVPSDKQTSLQF